MRKTESQRHEGGGKTNRAQILRETQEVGSGVVWDVVKGKGVERLPLLGRGRGICKSHCPDLVLGVKQSVYLGAPTA